MKVAAHLSEEDIKQAIVNYLRMQGFNTTVDKVSLSFPRPEHPSGPETFSASAECESKPQVTYRGPNGIVS